MIFLIKSYIKIKTYQLFYDDYVFYLLGFLSTKFKNLNYCKYILLFLRGGINHITLIPSHMWGTTFSGCLYLLFDCEYYLLLIGTFSVAYPTASTTIAYSAIMSVLRFWYYACWTIIIYFTATSASLTITRTITPTTCRCRGRTATCWTRNAWWRGTDITIISIVSVWIIGHAY